jgi:hypothetical protein
MSLEDWVVISATPASGDEQTRKVSSGVANRARHVSNVKPLDLILGDFATTEVPGSMSGLPNTHPETSQLLSRDRSFA